MKDCKVTKKELEVSKMPLRQTLAYKGSKQPIKKSK